MNNKIFIEQFNKNNILSDKSNLIDVIVLQDFNELVKLELRFDGNNYGYLYVNVKTIVSPISIIYDGVKLAYIECDGLNFVPINYKKGVSLEVVGECGELIIKSYGSKFKGKKLRMVLPLSNMIVSGFNNKTLYYYTGAESVVNNSLEKIMDVGSNVFYQTYVINGINYIGRLEFNEAVKFSSSEDHYSQQITFSVSGNSAIFIQRYSSGYVTFIYIRNYKVYYRYRDLSGEISDELSLNILSNNVPIDIIASSTNIVDSKFFGVVFDNGVTAVYIVKDKGIIEKVYEIKGFDVKLIEYESQLEIIKFHNYSAYIMLFGVDETKSQTNILSSLESKSISNIIDLIKIDNSYIYMSTGGAKGIISYE